MQEPVSVKTTIEIPDTLYREAKIRAVETGQTLKRLMLTALERELQTGTVNESKGNYWGRRKLRPGYKAALKAGAFQSGTDSTEAISADRDKADETVL